MKDVYEHELGFLLFIKCHGVCACVMFLLCIRHESWNDLTFLMNLQICSSWWFLNLMCSPPSRPPFQLSWQGKSPSAGGSGTTWRISRGRDQAGAGGAGETQPRPRSRPGYARTHSQGTLQPTRIVFIKDLSFDLCYYQYYFLFF